MRLDRVQVTPSLAKMLVSPDPRGIAEKLLSYLIGVLQAKGAAVLQYHSGRVMAFVSDRVDLDRLAEARIAWDRGITELESGEAVMCGANSALIPLIFGGALVGAVLLDDSQSIDLGEIAIPLAAAVAAPPMPQRGLEEALQDMSTEELQREKTLLLLRQNEWNVSRVSRLMGCSRRTIYTHLEKWGIQRLKPRKGLMEEMA